MGKAARRKSRGDDAPTCPLARHKAGLCIRCGKRPFRTGYVWCGPCTEYGHAIRRQSREHMPTPTREQWWAFYDALANPTDPLPPHR